MFICCCASSSVISPCPDLSWKVNFTSGQILASVLPLCKFVKTVVGLYGKNALFLSPLVVKDNGLISHVELQIIFFLNCFSKIYWFYLESSLSECIGELTDILLNVIVNKLCVFN